MLQVDFCTPCKVHEKEKCFKTLCPGVKFGDFEDFSKKYSWLQSTNRCDLVLCKESRVNFIELKASDRFVKDNGSLFSIAECINASQETAEGRRIKKSFNPENARKKLEFSKKAYFLEYPEQESFSVWYFFLFSDVFIDYHDEKKNVEVNTALIKLRLWQTIFATYPHNPVLHNGSPIPLKVAPCSAASEMFGLDVSER